MQRPTFVHFAVLILLAAIWGGSFLAMKVAVETVPPLTVTAGRLLLGAAVVSGFVRWRGLRLPGTANRDGLVLWRRAALIGALNTVIPFTAVTWGEQFIASGVAAILMGTIPLFAVILAHIFTPDDKATVGKALGVMTGLSGLVLLVGTSALAGFHIGLRGQMAVIVAALSHAASGVLVYRTSGRLRAEVLTAAVLLSGAALAVPLALLAEQPWTVRPSADAALAIGYLGLAVTALAFALRIRLIASVGYTFVAQSVYLIAPFGALWGWLIMDERLTASAVGALGLILLGIALSRLGDFRVLRRSWPRLRRDRQG
ncbi:MAG: DMT family transporter [Alphaproteobacteria bacterium]